MEALPKLDDIVTTDFKTLGKILSDRKIPVPQDKPGRIGAVTALVAMSENQAGPAATPLTVVPVESGLSADVTLAAEPPVEGENIDAAVQRIRQIRQPFGALTQKLALPQRAGYHRHWFNDVAGRIDEATQSGWSHIKGRDGSAIRRAVGTGRDNGVLYAYAMELPEVFWQEDMAARHAEAQTRLDAIKESPARAKPGQAKKSDSGKFYSPSEAGPVSINNR